MVLDDGLNVWGLGPLTPRPTLFVLSYSERSDLTGFINAALMA